jgi:hypothetical protein
MREIALRPGVEAEDYEKFMVEEVYPLSWPKGMKVYLLKGDRGDRENKYLWLWEFESVEARNRVFPSQDAEEESKEFQEFLEATRAVSDKSATFVVGGGIYTDYVVVDK